MRKLLPLPCLPLSHPKTPSANSPLKPSGQNHADSAGNPRGWRKHGGGESTGKLRGIFHVDSLGISLRFPAEFMRIFGGFIGDKSAKDFQGNSWRFSGEIMGNLQRDQGEI